MTQTASPSTADLVREAADQVSTLIRDEIKLAQAEMAEKGRHVARGVGMFGGAGLTVLAGRVAGSVERNPMPVLLIVVAGVLIIGAWVRRSRLRAHL